MSCLDNGNSCEACSCKSSTIEETTLVKGYINIYDIGGMYQAMSSIYDTKERAIEVGKWLKGMKGLFL